MNWDDVRFFLAAHRAQSLSKAARELGVDQSTVSRRLVALEKALGVRLFDRAPDGLTTTLEGGRLLAQAEKVEGSILELQRHASGEDARLQGTVRLALSEALARFLVPRLGDLRARHPEIRLELAVGRQLVSLVRREADIALRLLAPGAPPGEPSLVAEKLADVAVNLYGARDYVERLGPPQDTSDLRRFELVEYDATISARPGEAWIAENVGAMPVAMRCESMPAVVVAVVAGHGLGAFFEFVGDAERDLVPLVKGLEHWHVWLVVHPDLQNKPRVVAVREALAKIVRQLDPVLRGADGEVRTSGDR